LLHKKWYKQEERAQVRGLRTQCMLEPFSNKQSVCIRNASKIVLYKIPDSWVAVALSPAQTKKEIWLHADMYF